MDNIYGGNNGDLGSCTVVGFVGARYVTGDERIHILYLKTNKVGWDNDWPLVHSINDEQRKRKLPNLSFLMITVMNEHRCYIYGTNFNCTNPNSCFPTLAFPPFLSHWFDPPSAIEWSKIFLCFRERLDPAQKSDPSFLKSWSKESPSRHS